MYDEGHFAKDAQDEEKNHVTRTDEREEDNGPRRNGSEEVREYKYSVLQRV